MSIASSTNSFPLTGSLGLSVVSIAGGSGNAAANAATIATATDPFDPTPAASTPFSVLQSTASTTTSSPTIAALTTGELTNGQHKVIQAIGQSQGDQATIPWNANGTEPSQISSLRSLGWIKLVQPVQGAKGVASGVYSLTPVGQAIFKRTVGGDIGVPPTSADGGSSPDLSAVSAQLASGVSSVASLLSSVGVNVSV
jgi:hypothetical protein